VCLSLIHVGLWPCEDCLSETFMHRVQVGQPLFLERGSPSSSSLSLAMNIWILLLFSAL